MVGKKTFAVATKTDSRAVAKTTQLTVDYDGCPESTMAGLATQQLVVRLQSAWRKNGIPSTLTVAMKEYAPGTKHSGITAEQAVEVAFETAKNDPKAREELIRRLQALGMQK